MASTRNKNTPINYNLEQRSYKQSENYVCYENSQYGYAYNTRLPGDGLLPAQIPAMKLSNNAVDTESFLYGINSTNLVNPAPCFIPQIKELNEAFIYKKPSIYIPEPLILEENQRPFPIPN